MRRLSCSALVLILSALVACAPEETLRVSAIQVGKSLNKDRTVGTHATAFNAGDTMYAAVITAGSTAGATLTVRWSYYGQVMSEESRPLATRDKAVTEFHLQPPGGFPPGDYKVEILLNGTSVGVRDLRVER